MTENAKRTRACSFEQDLLWSVLDQDDVAHILAMARDNWDMETLAAWNEVGQQGAHGRLRAYRRTAPYVSVDLAQVLPDQAMQDYDLVVEPTKETFARLNKISASAGADANSDKS